MQQPEIIPNIQIASVQVPLQLVRGAADDLLEALAARSRSLNRGREGTRLDLGASGFALCGRVRRGGW